MTYRELTKQIKQASKKQKETEIIHYIEYVGDGIQWLNSNFMELHSKSSRKDVPTDDQLNKAEQQGLLIRDDEQLISYDATAYLVK